MTQTPPHSPEISAPAPARRVWRIFFWSVAGALSLYAATLAAGGYLLHRRLSPLFEAFLRRTVFTTPARGAFTAAGVSLFRGSLWLEGFSLPGSEGNPLVSIQKIDARMPLFSGDARRELSLSLADPSLHLNAAAGPSEPGLPSWAPLLLKEVPLRQASVSGGAVEVVLDPAMPPLRLESIDGLWRAGDGGGWTVEGRGRIPSDPPGDVSFKASFSGGTGELDLVLRNLPWSYLAERLSSPGEDIRFLSGLIDLKTSVSVREGFVTANPLVEIRDLRLEVPVEKKKFIGFSVQKLREVLEVGALSFTVPVNGRWDDPKVSFAVTLEQVLENALREKIPDDAERAKLARRGGWWLGRKADQAFRGWLTTRRNRA